MKHLGPQIRYTGPNGLGRITETFRQLFVVVEEDVGTTRNHKGGYNYRDHKFTKADVGKQVMVYTDEGGRWSCWDFAFKENRGD